MSRLWLFLAALVWPMIVCAGTASAGGVEFDAAIGKTGTGRCHMDECSFFSIQTSTPVAVLKDGTLFAISELSWSAAYKVHGDDDDHEYDRPPVSVEPKTADAFVVFCSKRRPHIFFYNDADHTWDALALRPGDEFDIAGATEAAHNSYWAACHHFITQDSASTKMAAKLGYHFSGAAPDPDKDPIKKPADLFK